MIRLKRAYEKAEAGDGTRILVERLWPRGVTKRAARIDLWLKGAAPSTELRKWFGHEPAKWPEFRKRYRAELKGNPAVKELRVLALKETVTLIFAAKDQQRNSAAVLQEVVEGEAMSGAIVARDQAAAYSLVARVMIMLMSLALLPETIRFSTRAFLFDNSRKRHRLVAEYENGRLKHASSSLPGWFVAAVLNSSGEN